MSAATTIRRSRRRSQLSLRRLAERAGTSHSAIAAYEAGRNDPSTGTLERLVRAAGFSLDIRLERRIRSADGMERGDELAAVLELAEQFPARHSRDIDAPAFGWTGPTGRSG